MNQIILTIYTTIMNKLKQKEIIKLSKINHHIRKIIKKQCKIEGEINEYNEANEILSIFKYTRLSDKYENNIDDEEIKTMKELTKLHFCVNKKITDEGIKGMTNLRELILSNNNKITNEGIEHLQNCKMCGR